VFGRCNMEGAIVGFVIVVASHFLDRVLCQGSGFCVLHLGWCGACRRVEPALIGPIQMLPFTRQDRRFLNPELCRLQIVIHLVSLVHSLYISVVVFCYHA
jgi:hypothetical protein